VGNVDNMGELVGILGCGTSSLPPLQASYKAKDVIVEKMGRRLAKVTGSPLLRAHFSTYLRNFCPSSHPC